MAKRIAWTDRARADVRAIDRQTAMRILHGLARFIQTEEGDVRRLEASNRRSSVYGSALIEFVFTITATRSRFWLSNTARRRTAEESVHQGPGLIPCGSIQRRAACVDGRLHIFGEVGIGYRRIAGFLFVRLSQRDALGDSAAHRSSRANDGERLRVAFDYHFAASLDTLQDSRKVANRISFVLCAALPRSYLRMSDGGLASGMQIVMDRVEREFQAV